MLEDIRGGVRILRWGTDILRDQRHVAKDCHKIQSEKLRDLVRHAYDNVDFYRQKYDAAGIRPEDIQSVDDIHKLPIVTKDDIRLNFPILAKTMMAQDCKVFGTTGSTGSPLKIYRQDIPIALPLPKGIISKLIGPLVRQGGRMRLMTILVTTEGAVENLANQTFESIPQLGTLSKLFLDALDDPQDQLEAIRKFQPNILITYPSVLRNVAALCREEGVILSKPQIIVYSAEMMDAHAKKLVGEVFEGELIEVYGSTEGEIMAIECFKHQGMHIQSEAAILEILQDGVPCPPGVSGQVMVTNLRNMACPIIRYAGLGDTAVLSARKCSCGSTLPLLEKVEGRIADSLVLADKRMVHPFRLTLALEHIPSMNRFQIIQETLSRVRVLVVSDNHRHGALQSPFAEGQQSWSMIVNNLTSLLGNNVSITVEEVSDIPRLHGAPNHPIVRSMVQR